MIGAVSQFSLLPIEQLVCAVVDSSADLHDDAPQASTPGGVPLPRPRKAIRGGRGTGTSNDQ